MKARFFVEEAEDRGPDGSFFVGIVKTGSLRNGMETYIENVTLIVQQIASLDEPDAMKESARKGSRISMQTQNMGRLSSQSLIGQTLDFSDEKTIPLKKAIFLTPEMS